MAALESVLKSVQQSLENGAGLHKAPALSQQVAGFAANETYPQDIRVALTNLSLALQNVACMGDPPTPEGQQRLSESIGNEYERVIFLLRSNVAYAVLGDSLPTLRPVNYLRNVFHVFNAVLAVSMYEFVLTYEQCIFCSFMVLAWYLSMDILRRFYPDVQRALFDKLFRSITRPRERFEVPAATWYCVSMFAVLLLARKTIAEVSVLVLGVGDPVATLIGRHVPSRKIRGQKSLSGTVGFVAVSGGVVLLFLTVARPDMTLPYSFSMALVAGVVGGVTELFSNDRFDDNLTIPLSVAAVLSVLF
jgi:dolichol kinase